MTNADDLLRGGVRFVAPAAVMGGGFSRRAFRLALESRPHFLACDAGSTDWGPYYLGAGVSWAGYRQTRRDLQHMVLAALDHQIPLLVGTAGFTGSEPGLAWFRRIVESILDEHGRRARIATIHTEVDADWVVDKIRAGRTWGLDGRPPLTEQDARNAARTVAMMGPEPYAEALDAGADIVLAGRSSDAALYAAVPLMRGVDAGAAWHMGKTVECGYAIATPIDAGECIVGSVDDEGFTVRPAGGRSRCTVGSVAAQMLYENASPYLLREPPGTLDTSNASYAQVDERTVRVTGARFTPEPYSVRLEGVQSLGHRSICLFGVRDPAVIAGIERYTERVTQLVERTAGERYGVGAGDFSFTMRRYGYDAVLGDAEPMLREPGPRCYEVGMVADAIAADQDTAHEIVSGAMPYFMHGVRVDGVANSANGALAYAPSVVDIGEVFTWSVWHAAGLDTPMEPFRVEVRDHDGAAAEAVPA